MNQVKMRHAERGQALVEMAVMLPLAIVAFFGTLYMTRAAVVTERTEQAARFTALMSMGQQSFDQYSLHAIVTNTLVNPSLQNPCDSPPSNASDVFTQTNAYNASSTNKTVPLLTPLANQVSFTCINTVEFPTPTLPYSGRQVVESVASVNLNSSDSALFGAANVMGIKNSLSNKLRRWIYTAYELAPTQSIHCFPDLVTDFSRSIKLHGIYDQSGAYGYGNYIDDVAVLTEPSNSPNPQPLADVAITTAPQISSKCVALDITEQNGPGNQPPIGMPSTAYSFYSDQWGTPGQTLNLSIPPSQNPPPAGPLATMPGPNDKGSGDPGIAPISLKL